MRTVDYSEILYASAALAGFGKDDIGAPEFALWRAFHDRRLQVAWEMAAWPEVCATERRQFRANWDAGKTYGTATDPFANNAANEVFDPPSGAYYQSLAANNLNNPPTINGAVNTAWWALCQTSYSGSDVVAGQSYALGTVVRNPENGNYYQLRAYIQNMQVAGAGYAPVNGIYQDSGLVDGREGYWLNGDPTQAVVWIPLYNEWVIVNNSHFYYAGDTDCPTPDLVANWRGIDDGNTPTSANDPPPTVTLYNVTPDISDATRWALLVPFNKFIAYEQAGLPAIGELFVVTDKDPRVTTQLRRFAFGMSQDGFQFPQCTPPQVWIQYRQRRPVLTGDVYDATATYAGYQQMYFAATSGGSGNFYTAYPFGVLPGFNPANSPGAWTVVPIPYFLRGYLIQGGYADWLTSDGQQDKAAAAEAMAASYLELEADKLQRQEQQVRRFTVSA